MLKNKKIIICIISFLCIMLITANYTYAIDTGAYTDIYSAEKKDSAVYSMGGKVLGVVQTIGYATSLIMLTILGIKYMISSTDEKATIKERAVLYIIGAVVMFAASGLIGIIAKWANTSIR